MHSFTNVGNYIAAHIQFLLEKNKIGDAITQDQESDLVDQLGLNYLWFQLSEDEMETVDLIHSKLYSAF